VDPNDARAAARGEAEEDGLHEDAHRVRVDALRDSDGRHPLAEVQAQQGDGGRRDSAEGQEERARHHPRIHQEQAPFEIGNQGL